LDSRPDPTAPVVLEARWPQPRASETDVYTYNLTVGLEGSVPGTDWTWEAFGSHGESHTHGFQTGFASLQRFRYVMGLPNFGAGMEVTGNPEGGGFGAASATCTSGFNLFRPQTISQDCFDAVAADLKTDTSVRQTIAEANLQ